MNKPLRLLLTIAALGTAVVAPGPSWDPGDGLSWRAEVKEASAQRRKKKKKPAPPPKETPPAEQPAPATQTPPGEEQQPVIEIEPETGTPPVEITPEATPTTPETEAAAAPNPQQAAATHGVSWQDVVVVMRKPFLKQGRLEIQPSWNVTLNDNMIRHHAFQGQLIYWLTDVLAVGAEGQYFTRFGFLEPHELVASAYRRVPTINQYNWGGALDFHYAPMYAKFAVFNKYLVHWEGMFTVGVGVMQSEVIPRDPMFPGWTNLLIVPNIGFQARVFVTDWITLDFGVKDYIFVDKFESVNRTTADVEQAMAEASTQLINHIMFTAGFSFWIPTSFRYTTFR